MWEFTHHRQVEFIDVDLGGVMHFSNYFRFMESAEHAFFRSLGLPILEPWEGRTLAWPRVRAHCHYQKPLRFGDTVAIRVVVTQKRRRSLELGFAMERVLPDGSRERTAIGLFRLACVEIDPVAGRMTSMNLPVEVDSRLTAAPAEIAHEFSAVAGGR